MKIAVLGTGNVGSTIGSKLIDLGHEVVMGSRSATNEKALAFVAKNPEKAKAETFEEAAKFGEILFNCTLGSASIEVLTLAGEKNLAGKTLIDLSNPLDFSNGIPPSLSVCNTHSLAEEIQKQFPELNVVKALNTMWCGVMVNPGIIGGGDHHTFLSGNNLEAKAQVKDLLITFGWLEKNILDLGDITTARGTEMYLPLWLRIWGATKNGAFNIRIVGE